MASSVVIKSVAAVRVVALRKTVANYRAQTSLWTRVTAFCMQHKLEPVGPCFSVYFDQGYKEKDVDMEACQPVRDDVVLPPLASESEEAAAVWGDIEVRSLPAIPKAASITVVGSYDKLPQAYQTLYTWIGSHGYRPCGPPVREVYLKMDPADTTEASFVTEILQAIE